MGTVFRIASILGFMIACVAGASGQGRIQEEFKSKLNSELWVLKANGSKLEGSPSGLQLMGNPNGTAFPEISTRGGLLPFNMDWKLRFAVRYNHIGPYGAGYGIRNQNGDGLFVVWAGSNLAPSMVANDHGVPIDNVV